MTCSAFGSTSSGRSSLQRVLVAGELIIGAFGMLDVLNWLCITEYKEECRTLYKPQGMLLSIQITKLQLIYRDSNYLLYHVWRLRIGNKNHKHFRRLLTSIIRNMGCVCGAGTKISTLQVAPPEIKPHRSHFSSSTLTAQPSAQEVETASVALYSTRGFGRSESIRFLLKYLNLDFEDRRIGDQEMERAKGRAEFGDLPMLVIDDKKLVQLKAILRYVAQKHGLYPNAKDIDNIYWMESLCDLVEEMRNVLLEATTERPVEERYAQATARLVCLEKRLMRNKGGKGWYIGSQVSLADVVVVQFLWDFYLLPGLKEKHEADVPEKLRGFVKFFLALYSHVNGYLSTRPHSDLYA